MGSLARAMRRNNSRKHKFGAAAATAQTGKTPRVTELGIFCDCHGTLFSHDFAQDDLLVAYLNAKYATGWNVVLISAEPGKVRDKIRDIGLHADIVASLTHKNAYYGDVLEVLIDDDPVLLKAGMLHHPKNADFRRRMAGFVEQNPATVSIPIRPSAP